MNTKHLHFTALLLVFFSLVICPSFAQNANIEIPESGGAYPMELNTANHPCISAEQYKAIEKGIAENIKLLGLDKVQRKATATSFSWPLMPANGLNDCSYYFIGNYVDQDTTATNIKDYNCGTVTYDGHRGTDIASWPYPILKMDSNMLNVVAAAPGTIIQKSDGYFDKNCAMSSDTANYIIVQHADGSVALYWHMKKNSLTVKTVGQTVTTGEFLGVVGSSGSSTDPHLHFEVWSSTTPNTLQDPFMGACNTLNATSLWASQKPYTEPAIVKASVNPVLAVFPACPATETPNEDSCFDPGANVRFYIFIRNEVMGDTAKMRIINPDTSTFLSWTHVSNLSHLDAYWISTKTLPTTPGIYTFEATYNNTTCTKTFKVNCQALGTQTINDASQIQVFPNPANNNVTIALANAENGNCSLTIKNVLGQVMLVDNIKVEHNTLHKTYSISGLPNGIYFLTIETAQKRIVQKIIKEN